MGLILGSESKTLAFLFTVNLNRANKGFILKERFYFAVSLSADRFPPTTIVTMYMCWFVKFQKVKHWHLYSL